MLGGKEPSSLEQLPAAALQQVGLMQLLVSACGRQKSSAASCTGHSSLGCLRVAALQQASLPHVLMMSVMLGLHCLQL